MLEAYAQVAKGEKNWYQIYKQRKYTNFKES
ncbi:hypothetical protein F4694_001143 [Bacillus niacini]|uniref:Uncharacterized protein n=1 Tax=Neobacillus niacini TaxID=86668 RepID=A0A852T952_9BACI|nr:hypothetical protein [Neobacillus niacini]